MYEHTLYYECNAGICMLALTSGKLIFLTYMKFAVYGNYIAKAVFERYSD